MGNLLFIKDVQAFLSNWKCPCYLSFNIYLIFLLQVWIGAYTPLLDNKYLLKHAPLVLWVKYMEQRLS